MRDLLSRPPQGHIHPRRVSPAASAKPRLPPVCHDMKQRADTPAGERTRREQGPPHTSCPMSRHSAAAAPWIKSATCSREKPPAPTVDPKGCQQPPRRSPVTGAWHLPARRRLEEHRRLALTTPHPEDGVHRPARDRVQRPICVGARPRDFGLHVAYVPWKTLEVDIREKPCGMMQDPRREFF